MTPSSPDPRAAERERLREALRHAMKDVHGIYPIDRYEGDVKIGKLRRRGESSRRCAPAPGASAARSRR